MRRRSPHLSLREFLKNSAVVDRRFRRRRAAVPAGDSAADDEPDLGSARHRSVWEFYGKLDGLIYVVEVYSHFAALVLTAVVCFAVGWGVRHRALQFHSFGWALLIVGGIVYVAMPRIMFETYMADQRLPISLAFMVIACAHLNLRHDYVRRGFATVLVLLMAMRVFEVQTVWADLSNGTESFRDSVRHIDRGSKILVAYADADAGDDVRDLGLVHAACLAIIERSALVTTAFTVVGKQILHVRENYPRPRRYR